MAGAKVPLTFRIFKGDQLLREEKLSLSVIKLGKVPSAHLKLDDETVSRMHAIIEVNGPGDVSIIDLGSTKGTFVNGQKVNKAKLQSGDTIVVGETRIELAIGAGEEEDVATSVNLGAAPPAPAQDVVASTPRPAAPPVQPMAQTMQAPPPAPTPRAPAPPAPAPQQAFAPPPAPSYAPPPSAPSNVRPPPGMAIYGTATAAPATGFQASMAGEADDIGGARAVEVAAMLGDSVVGVKHCMDPRGGKVTPVTYGFFAFALAMILMAGVSFYMAVDNAAYNKGRYDYETQVLKKPGFAVRPRILPMAYDWMMFGGFFLGIMGATYGLARMRSEKKSPFFRIGTAPGVEFATEGAPSADFPLVAPSGDDFAFNFASGMEGEMVVNGQSTSLQELAAQGRTTISPIPPGAKIRVRAGKTTFLVSAVPQPRRHAMPLFAALESRVLAYFAGSLAVHLGFWLVLEQIPVEDSGANIDLASLEDTSTRTNSASQDDPPPPEEEEKPDDGADESGGTGTAMALEEGKMGKKDSDRAEGQYKMKKEQEDPQLARQQAIEQARTAGILGSSALTQGGAFASLTGTGDISSGFDDGNIYGGLLGNEAGEMNGGFGFGRSGFGPGGGGTGWGTIGTGRYGTIGHGSGTGSGYGVGGGRGGMRGRTASVPTVSIGQPNAQGDLDKAIIRRYIKRNIQKIQYCYEKELLAKPGLAGTVSTQFFITPNGNVASSSGSGVDGNVASCVAGVIKDIEFPKPKGGGGVQVNYPFTFRPAGS
ncbi:MAG: AgmX/PglI C-terminal domain-containing protein [Myxococcales bacterium]|nr:AgmX/PglI C-terminal domain-containing protein [Myxococcales bacterium]